MVIITNFNVCLEDHSFLKKTLFDIMLSSNKIIFKVVSGDTRTLKTQESLKMDVTCDLFRSRFPPCT